MENQENKKLVNNDSEKNEDLISEDSEENKTVKKQLAINEKERIIDLRIWGYKIKDISDIYQISEKTVKRLIKKNKELHTL